MRMTPKMSVSPLASRNSSAPYDTPLNVWISQKFASRVLLPRGHRVASVPYETARQDRLFTGHRASAAQAARRGAHGGLDHRQRRGMGHRPADAAHRAHAASGRGAHARHPELGVARIWKQGGLLAFHADPGLPRHPGGARDQRYRGK